MITEWKRQGSLEPGPLLRASYAVLALVFAEKVGRADVWRKQLEGFDVQESKIVKEWQDQAVRKSLHTHIQQVLQTRFPGSLPAELVSAIERQADLDVLSRWLTSAVTTASVEDFKAVVGNGALSGS